MPDEQTMLIATVLQDIKDALENQKNSDLVTIEAQTPNAYYWAKFGPLEEEEWLDNVYGDIREMPSFGMGIAEDKIKALELLKDKGVVRHLKVNSFKENHGLNQPIDMVRSFEVELNLIKFLKYYEKYTKAARPAIKRANNDRKPSLATENTDAMARLAPVAEVKIDGTKVLIGYADNELILQKSVRLDGPLYNFMHYLYSHTEKAIALADIQSLSGCASIIDLSEQVRYLGFSKEMKKIFFDEVSEKRVRFKPKVSLTQQQNDSFDEHLKRLVKKP